MLHWRSYNAIYQSLNSFKMLHIMGIIAIMMVISFAVAMGVAFIIKQATVMVERLTLASSKPDEIRRVKKIHKLSKHSRKVKGEEYARRYGIELIDHYYGDNKLDSGESQRELLNHFYPKSR